MDSFHAVFLYFSCMTVVASRVLPPANVTLHCRNFHNVLKWSYPEDTTGLSFRLDIGAYQNPPDIRTWNTSALQADLSFLSDPNDSYYVAVTAVVNGNESEPAPSEDGITFSYFHENPVETKCYLDLPPVNVTAQRDNKVQISFVNPSVFYCEKMKKNKKKCLKDNGSKDSSFKVKILNQTHSFTCEERVCENTLPVDAAQPEHCVNITGQTSQGTLVKAKQLYCAKPFHEPSQSNFTAVYVVSAILAVATFGVILFMAFQKLTKPRNSSFIFWEFPKSFMQSTSTPESVTVDHVECSKRCDEVEPSSPTPLLSQTEEEDRTRFTNYDSRFPIRVSHNGDMSNVMEEEQPNGEGPGYMVGNNIGDENPDSGDENPGSGYEKRNTVAVEMGPDEVAKGYRGPVAPE